MTSFESILFVTLIWFIFFYKNLLNLWNFAIILLSSSKYHLKLFLILIHHSLFIMLFQQLFHLCFENSCLLLFFSSSTCFKIISRLARLQNALNAFRIEVVSSCWWSSIFFAKTHWFMKGWFITNGSNQRTELATKILLLFIISLLLRLNCFIKSGSWLCKLFEILLIWCWI